MKGRIFNLREEPDENKDNDNDGSGDDESDSDDSSEPEDDDSDVDDDMLGSVGRRPNPMDERRFRRLLLRMRRGNLSAQEQIFDAIRMAIGVFRYINHPDALPTIQRNRRELRGAIALLAQARPSLRNAVVIQREFDNNWYREAADRARDCVSQRILDIRLPFSQLAQDDELPPNWAEIQSITDRLFNLTEYIVPPPDIYEISVMIRLGACKYRRIENVIILIGTQIEWPWGSLTKHATERPADI